LAVTQPPPHTLSYNTCYNYHYISAEVSDSKKRTILQYCTCNYGCKNFYGTIVLNSFVKLYSVTEFIEKNSQNVCCTSSLVSCLWHLPYPMFVERWVSYSALFTFLNGLHTIAVSLHQGDIILAQLVCPLNDIFFVYIRNN